VEGSTITIITGKSGSGRSTALAAFEDSGYYCVDNMPVALLPAFLDISKENAGSVAGFVFGMDMRASRFIHRYESVLEKLKDAGYRFRIIFIEADEKTLLRRYSQTRRRHPLATDKSVHQAIAEEEATLSPLRRKADTVIDTSDLNVHEVKAIIRKIADAGTRLAPLRIQVLSFGFRFGLPAHADLVMDVRFLKNPYFVESLRPLSGESEKIRSFVLNNDQTGLFLQQYFGLLDTLIPQYESEGKAYLTIAFGCTGGRHRSVVIARELCDHLAASGCKAELTHRDIDKTLSP
jgi:RNase adapter protein RapZ